MPISVLKKNTFLKEIQQPPATATPRGGLDGAVTFLNASWWGFDGISWCFFVTLERSRVRVTIAIKKDI